jgi:hypothetical protein
LYLAATLSLLSGIIHLWVMQGHFEEWWGYGAFFLVLAIFEGLYAVTLLNWPRRLLFILGIVARISVISLYLVSRTAGVPLLGPHAGHVEEVAIIDLISLTVNIALGVALAGLLLPGDSDKRVKRRGPVGDQVNSQSFI